jgi:hypothetical protein
VVLRLAQTVVDGQHESSGKQWQLSEAKAMEHEATKAVILESFILTAVSLELDA